ncbi:DUF4864 domain-containing protein [Abyssibius alkaniclasticus]|uniref:DUF4864 domain-containing protein n=1 Tax=Abyssibius alkaniclasticus TaxID=2881234 RepID=UPI0023639980|nr:DUF4864 domain-containing protein [Abyssibius alkaniclasticus]UPH70756.1 DUF4864 domain-containing protein [Abyssibius alkaniclasticus]|tara:strand:- start:1009 stop:1416 length:408 start_codon:yes stop_codon:yes gene_type:complete
MRRLIVVFILFIAPALGQAQSAPDAEIRDIITRQLEAFQQDDFATAFTFASPALQGIFQTPERFGDMVTGGYPMVYRPQDYRFDSLSEAAGSSLQKLLVWDNNGRGFLVEYQMIETEDGWRINGVSVTPLPDVAV